MPGRTHEVRNFLKKESVEARRIGDGASAEEVEKLASTLAPKDQVEKLVQERLRKDGHFKVTKEDLRIA